MRTLKHEITIILYEWYQEDMVLRRNDEINHPLPIDKIMEAVKKHIIKLLANI